MTWTEVHGRALDAVFGALTESGVPWLVLRNHQGLPWCNKSKDIDIGVEQRLLRDAEVVVEGVMKEHGFDRKETTIFQWGRCTSYFGVINGAAMSMKIDLMDGFSWRTAGIFDAARLLERAVPYKGFWITDPIDDATIMWLKPLMTGGYVKQAYISGIASGVAADPARFRANLERLFPNSLAALAWQHLESGNYEDVLTHRKKLAWSAWAREVALHPARSTRNAFSYVFWELVRRTRRPNATFFAVLGPDGVGKTTFIAHFSAKLMELQAKDASAIQVQHFRPHTLPNINELITGKSEIVTEFNNPHSAKPASMPSSILRITYYWLDYLFGYWLKLRSRLIRGHTIIFDRYFYDFIVDPRRSRLSLPNWVPRLLLTITPKPDLVFFLDADADKIFVRKQELQPVEIDRQLIAYRQLTATDPSRFVRLDANKSPEEIVEIAASEAVTRLYSRL